MLASSSSSSGLPYRGDPMASAALGFSNFVNGALIRHPFVVLRRQCQVHDHAARKHLTPNGILRVCFRFGRAPLAAASFGWFHMRPNLLLLSFLICQSLLCPTAAPNDFGAMPFSKLPLSLLALLSLSLHSSKLSDGASLSEDLQLFEIIHRGLERLHLDLFGSGIEGRRRHPLLLLALPTSLFHTAHFLVSRSVYSFAFSCTRAYVSRKLPSERKRYHSIMPELFSTMTSVFVADLNLPPMLLNPQVLADRILAHMPDAQSVDAEVLSIISMAAEARLRAVLANLATLADHRQRPLRIEPHYALVDEPRKQIRFMEEIERRAHENRETAEKEAMMRTAKSKGGKDRDVVEKAKLMQKADREATVNREANLAAFAALGVTKTGGITVKRQFGAPNGPGAAGADWRTTGGLIKNRPPLVRLKRVTMRDLQYFLCNDPLVPSSSRLRYRIALSTLSVDENNGTNN